VTRTLQQRLGDAVLPRGLSWDVRPDEPVSSPPHARWWGCVYDKRTGDVAVLVTSSGGTSALRRLLDGLDAPPPVLRSAREGTVLRAETGSGLPWKPGRVDVEFGDGAAAAFLHPWGVHLEPGWPVRELAFEGHEGVVLQWGPDHLPRRLTEHAEAEA
jgi:hypothetical protein